MISAPCLTPRCPDMAAYRGRCRTCNQRRERERGGGSPKGWRKIRARILKRDPFCKWEGCSVPSQDVDHIIPRVAGGGDEDSNLRGLCRHHNRRKGARAEVLL